MPVLQKLKPKDGHRAVSKSVSVIFCFESNDPPVQPEDIAEALCLQSVHDLRSYDKSYHRNLGMILHSGCCEENWDSAAYFLAECSDLEQVKQLIVTLKLVNYGYKGTYHYDPSIIKEKWSPLINISRDLMEIDDHASSASVKAIAFRRKVPSLMNDHLYENIREKLSAAAMIIGNCHEFLESAFRAAAEEVRID